MKIHENVSLSGFSTMRLGGKAAYFTVVNSEDEAIEAVAWAKQNNKPIITIGGGSNIIFRDEGFDGLVIKNDIEWLKIDDITDGNATVKVAAGLIWDRLVEKTVEHGLTGIEALSLIPGKVGGAPVQNIGAYGQQLEDTFVELEAIDTETGETVTLSKNDCKFGYRTSIFKEAEHGRYVILSITLQLRHGSIEGNFYHVLQKYLDDNKISDHSPARIREAVIAIRKSKLPNPIEVANTGSFFKNPVVTRDDFEKIKQDFPDVPGFEQEDGKMKLSAGWLLEQSGYTHYLHPNGMGTYEKHPLIVVNYGASNFADLGQFTSEIIESVKSKFGITLEVEPEILPKVDAGV